MKNGRRLLVSQRSILSLMIFVCFQSPARATRATRLRRRPTALREDPLTQIRGPGGWQGSVSRRHSRCEEVASMGMWLFRK
jgi:hypothetical protein